jgi:uncharacterized protein (DUF305 family)
MRTIRPVRRTIGVTLAALTAIAVAAGCTGDDGHDATSGGGHTSAAPNAAAPTASGDTAHNDADVTFAMAMVAHHRQAVEMTASAATQAGNPEVKAIAAKIKVAQEPEIDLMQKWLTGWGVPAVSASAGGHGMPGMADSEMPGMMSDEDMASLKNAKGAEFDNQFLEMMIGHHEGAVEMVDTELQKGQSPAAKALASQIKTVQAAEIEQMKALLQKL